MDARVHPCFQGRFPEYSGVRMRVVCSIVLLLSCLRVIGQATFRYVEDGRVNAPPVAREFRAAWIATVANIDWPSQPGLPPEQQRTEMIAILDRAYHLRMNAVILQVRPTSDALYPSKLEPWSWYLTGKMGEAPDPYYDPLLFTIREAHRRNLEVHAWFNPFRARHPSATGVVSPQHITRRRPDLVREYASLEWLDPGDPQVQSHALSVILDVLHRYDVDGIHIDDYFYPYPEKTRAGKIIPFPDAQTYARYRRAGGRLKVEDWRRDNVNRFVRHLYVAIKQKKPWVKFGISPFGIWRPGHPKEIKGMDAYDSLYADALTWWQLGWVDYLAPQLYWSIDQPAQSFPVLLNWWAAQNKKGRHLWPGISVRGTTEDRHPNEVLRQVGAVRRQPRATGQIYWGMNSILTNRLGVAHQLQQRAYTTPALVPASPWLTPTLPAKPQLHFGIRADKTLAAFHWQSGSTNAVSKWILQQNDGGEWTTRILPGGQHSVFIHPPFERNLPGAVVLTPIDRAGVAGSPFRATRRGP